MLRRNGMLGSCESCRKSKIRCDHRTPTCGTCEARSIACEYRPAPLTQSRPPATNNVAPHGATNANGGAGWFGVLDLSSSSTDRQQQRTRPTSVPARGEDISNSVRAHSERHGMSSSSSASNASRSADRHSLSDGVASDAGTSAATVATTTDHTYYGSTSSVSTFQETVIPPNRSTNRTDMAAANNDSALVSGQSHVELGAWVVAQLEHVETICALAEKYVRATLVSPVASLVPVETIRTLKTLYTPLAFSNTECQRTARNIIQNTSQHIHVHADLSARHFLALFVGEKLRWEFLGLIFAWAGRAAADASPHSTDVAPPQGFTNLSYARRMLECSNSCISLYRPETTPSDMLVWCMYENLILSMFEHGESSHQAWRRLCDLSAEIFASGLHRVPEQPPTIPPVLAQARKKVFHASYSIDKAIATFFGRPPRIPGHYCSTSLPFDVDDGTILDGLSPAKVVLDTSVWNAECKFYSATWIRVRSIISQIREKVLEMLLDPKSPTVSAQAEFVSPELWSVLLQLTSDSRDLLTRSRETWQSIPSFMRYSAECWSSTLPTITCTILLMVYLEHLQNQFHLRRSLSYSQPEPTTRDALFDISIQILETALALPGVNAKRPEIPEDRTWILLHFAVPSAAVIANEVRLRTQRSESLPSQKSRSKVIRHVSVLISILEATNPLLSGGNSHLCENAAKTLSQILSDVLDNQAPAINNDWAFSPPFSMSLLTDASLDLAFGGRDTAGTEQALLPSLYLT